MRAITQRVRRMGRSNDAPLKLAIAAAGCELLVQGMEKRGLHARLRQEELGDAQPAVDRPGHRRGEDVGARPAGQPGRLGVDVGDRAGVRIERLSGSTSWRTNATPYGVLTGSNPRGRLERGLSLGAVRGWCRLGD